MIAVFRPARIVFVAVLVIAAATFTQASGDSGVGPATSDTIAQDLVCRIPPVLLAYTEGASPTVVVLRISFPLSVGIDPTSSTSIAFQTQLAHPSTGAWPVAWTNVATPSARDLQRVLRTQRADLGFDSDVEFTVTGLVPGGNYRFRAVVGVPGNPNLCVSGTVTAVAGGLAGAPEVDSSITWVLPSWSSLHGSSSNFLEMANAIRTRIPDGPKAKMGFSMFVSLPMNSWTVDTTDAAAIRTLLAAPLAQIDQAIANAKLMDPPMPIGLSLVTAIRSSVDPLQTAAQAEDLRNVQWYGDNTVADGWMSFSQYATKMRRFQEAYVREFGAALRERIAANPDVLVAVTGDGEIEMSFDRFRAFSDADPAIADYSPYAIAEFRDWLRGTGAYASGQRLAGQHYANASRYRNDPSPAQDSSPGDGRTFNGDFGTNFTDWQLRYFNNTFGALEEAGQLTSLTPGECALGLEPDSNNVCQFPTGFDAPRSIPMAGTLVLSGDLFWQAWIRFRQEMVWRYNKDFARWITESTVPAQGGVPYSRFYSAQVPADVLFTNQLGFPNDRGLRLLTGASPHWVADIRPYGGAGVTGYNANSGGCSTTAPCTTVGSVVQTPGGNGPFFRTTDVVAPLVSTFGRWAIVEWNPADPYSDSLTVYRDDMRTVRRYRPSLLMPFIIGSDHWKVFELGATLPFETALRELMQGRTDSSTPADNHTGIANPGAWQPRITWPTPGRVVQDTALSATQLNATANVAGNFVYTPALGTVMTTGTRQLSVTFTPTDPDYAPTSASVSLLVDPLPVMSVSPLTPRRFSANRVDGTITGLTPAQTVTVNFTNPGITTWRATADQPWVTITGDSGTGAGQISVDINADLFPDTSSASATVTVTATGVTPASAVRTFGVEVTITTVDTDVPPIGRVETPSQNTANVQGSIAFTGWAVDDRGVSSVLAYRNCIQGLGELNSSGNPVAPCRAVVDHKRGRTWNLVLLGTASFIAGARPDIENAFSHLPASNRGGWGFLILTSMLPNVAATPALRNGGEGPLELYAVATDTAGQSTMLGRTQVPDGPGYNDPTHITMANLSIGKPFGAIDTPGQGRSVSGTLLNYGWALTPDLNTIGGEVDDRFVPETGPAGVLIDGVRRGSILFNLCRGNAGNPVPSSKFCDDDVSNIFGNVAPRPVFTERLSNPTPYRNLDAGAGPIGLFVLDTTTLSNGLHTIAWAVYDNVGRVEGIGSRFFTVLNSGARGEVVADAGSQFARSLGNADELSGLSPITTNLRGRSGLDERTMFSVIGADDHGVFRARARLSDRIQFDLGGPVDKGYLVANGTLRSLPAGSTLQDDGLFSWGNAPGYLGDYDLVFVRGRERIDVRVTIAPDPETDGPAVRMHMDPARVAGMAPNGRIVTIGGWAYDPAAGIGSGVGAVHVWARRTDVGGLQTPLFLGQASIDGKRPDVARAFADAPPTSGFGLLATLPPGTYEITSYVWLIRTGRFEDARTVTVTVR